MKSGGRGDESSSGGDGGDGSSSGGTFCRFTVGRPGTGAAHLRYISRESAVLERERGVLLHRVPEAVSQGASTYAALRDSLIAYAWAREEAEGKTGRPRGARTHYRLLVSFEQDSGVTTPRLHALLVAWLEEAVPQARAIGFVHRDTAHPHAHLFVEARGVDGRQLDFSARAWRQLDEVWNRIYAHALDRDVGGHLIKKQETEAYKRAWQQGQQQQSKETSPDRPDKPGRAARALSPAEYRERDRRGAGARDTRDINEQPGRASVTEQEREQQQGREGHERDTTRVGGDQRAAAARAAPAPNRERVPARGKQAARAFPASRDAADGAAESALSETVRLREDLARLGSGRDRSGDRSRGGKSIERDPAAAQERQARQVEPQGDRERDESSEQERER